MNYEIIFPSAVTVALRYLNSSSLMSTRAVNEIPDRVPSRFVRVTNVPARRRDIVIQDGKILVEAYASTRAEADEVARRTAAVIDGMRGVEVGDDYVYWAESGGVVDNHDHALSLHRSQFTATIRMRGEELTPLPK